LHDDIIGTLTSLTVIGGMEPASPEGVAAFAADRAHPARDAIQLSMMGAW
jgi:hypothetical protein